MAQRSPWLDAPRTRAIALILLAVTMATVGHAAWWASLDTSPSPFLPDQAAGSREAITDVFPNATPPTVRIVLVAEQGGGVLSPDALTALAGLRSRISSDPVVSSTLARERPLTSVLSVLEPHLEGRAGQWDDAAVASAVENVSERPVERRALASLLDANADLQPPGVQASATVMIVRLDARASPERLLDAEERIRAFAREARAPGITLLTDAPAAGQRAAQSPWSLWLPAGILLLIPLAGLALGARPRVLPGWVLVHLAGSGTGLAAASLAGASTPTALAAANAGAILGLSAAVAYRALTSTAGPTWPCLLAALPVGALILWAPAGTGALALAATAATAATITGLQLAPGLLALGPPPLADLLARVPVPERGLPRLLGPGLTAVALVVVLASAGLPADPQGGWKGQLPSQTEPGRAEDAMETHFGGIGPGAGIVVAAWGPVTEPGFLAALDETSQRLERLSLAASGDSVSTILTLARDWASDETGADRSDTYDARFAERWRNATDERGIPTSNTTELFQALAELDPEGVGRHLVLDPEGVRGVALLTQRVTRSEIVPHPGAAVEASLQPLVAASDRIARGGLALDDQLVADVLTEGRTPVLLASAAASLVAAMAWLGRARGSLGLGLLSGAMAVAGILGTAGLASWAGVPLSPVTLLAWPWAGGLTLALVAPSMIEAASVNERRGADTAMRRLRRRMVRQLWRPLVPSIALVIAALSAPTPAIAMAGAATGFAVLVAGLITVLALPGSVDGWVATMAERTPTNVVARAHQPCPVCQELSVTGASRCTSCGSWNLMEACPVHPEAMAGRCAACSAELEAPRFR